MWLSAAEVEIIMPRIGAITPTIVVPVPVGRVIRAGKIPRTCAATGIRCPLSDGPVRTVIKIVLEDYLAFDWTNKSEQPYCSYEQVRQSLFHFVPRHQMQRMVHRSSQSTVRLLLRLCAMQYIWITLNLARCQSNFPQEIDSLIVWRLENARLAVRTSTLWDSGCNSETEHQNVRQVLVTNGTAWKWRAKLHTGRWRVARNQADGLLGADSIPARSVGAFTRGAAG